MAADLDHERIRAVQDRSWTARLIGVAREPSTQDEERDEAFESLRALDDHRSYAALIAMVEDQGLGEATRRGASWVLGEIDDTTTLAQRARWWDEGDDITRAHALGDMGRSEAPIVVAVASDDRHPLQACALEAMAFDFAEPPYGALFARALGHDDARVRRAAAETAIWDEWNEAEAALLAAAADPSPEVAGAALRCLRWYPTRQVLRVLSELELHEDEDVREDAAETLDRLCEEFEGALRVASPAERVILSAWMAPVVDLVDLTADDEDEPDPAPVPGAAPSSRVALPVAAHEIQAMLADPDGEWAARKATLREVDWAGHSPAERAALAAEFIAHPDHWVRWFAAAAFRAWGDRDALILQLLDPSSDVRSEATEQLGELGSDPALAPILWARMLGTAGSAAEEALKAYVVHAGAHEAPACLLGLARDDPREHVRLAAISSLADLSAVQELEELVPVLDDDPGVTWSVHVELLEAMAAHGVDASEETIDRLTMVDHLDVQRAVAVLRAGVTRP